MNQADSLVAVEGHIEYLECNLAPDPIESAPVLRLFYSGHLVRTAAGGGIKNIALDEKVVPKRYPFRLTGHTNSRYGDKLPATASIGFYHYAMRRNEYGMACYTGAGTTHLTLGDILGEKDRLPVRRELPLIMGTTRLNGETPVVKGKICVQIDAIHLGPSITFVRAELCPLGASSMTAVDELLSNFISARIQAESEMRDKWPGVKNVRAPMDISDAGIEMTKDCFVPSDGFALYEPLQTNAAYYQNALERIMDRRGLSFKRDFKTLDVGHKAELLVDMCNYAAQSFDYVSDTVDTTGRLVSKRYDPLSRKGFEHWHKANVTLSGDCEDLANSAYEFAMTFLNTNVPDLTAKRHPELIELRGIGRQYVFFETLATTHGARAKDSNEGEHIGAHLFGVWEPIATLKPMFEKTPEGREFIKRINFPAPFAAALPTLISEGTGNLRALGNDKYTLKMTVDHAIASGNLTHQPSAFSSYDPIIEERMYVAQHFKHGGIKSEIPRIAGEASNFYLGVLSGLSAFAMDQGVNVGSFIFGTVEATTGEVVRGVDFVDIINQKDRVAIIPTAAMPQNIMDITREAVSLNPPSQEFFYNPDEPVAAGLIVHPEWERMKTTVASWKRTGTAPYGSVDIFVRPHQFNANVVSSMIQNASRMPRLFAMDYVMEPITNKIHVYRVKLFIDQKK